MRVRFRGRCPCSIVSAPLIIGMDITDKAVVDAVWPILSNKEAITVNQAWAGHPGRLVLEDPKDTQNSWQIWAKAMPAGGQAVFVVNRGLKAVDVTVPLTSVGLTGTSYKARDIWAQKDIGPVTGTWKVASLGAHDSAFVRFSK